MSLPRIHWLICNVRRGFRKFCVWDVGRREVDLASPTRALPILSER